MRLQLIVTAAVMAVGCETKAIPTNVAPGAPDPVVLQAQGRAIEPGGTLFPALGDIDGDGLDDLLVGTDHDGGTLVYRNVGTRTRPRYAAPYWLDAIIPDGRIPPG